MFDKFSSFKSHFISKIQNLFGLHHAFCLWLDTSAYVMDLLYKNKYFCDNIKSVDNLSHGWKNVSDKTIGLRAIFSPYNC